MGPHEMDPYVKKDEKGNLINRCLTWSFCRGMSTEPIAEKSIPTFKKFLKQHTSPQLRQREPNRLWLIPARQNKPEDTKKTGRFNHFSGQ